MHQIAIYDLDKTITRKATFGPFIAHVLRHYRPWRVWALPAMALTTLGYGLKLLDRGRLKEINLRLLLGSRISEADAGQIAQSFAQVTTAQNCLSGALHQIAADRAAGFKILIASASYRFYVSAIANSLQIDSVIATECTAAGAVHFSSMIDGENCYGAEKLVRIKSWLAQREIDRQAAHIRFYSDHVSDSPCLEWADEAFATNPHPPLARWAEVKGWPILNWLSER